MTTSIINKGLTRAFIKKEYQEEVLEELAQKAEKKSAIKAERKAQKAEKREARKERRAQVFSSVKEKLARKANEEPVAEEGVFICYETPEKKGEIYEATLIEVSQIVDSSGKVVPDLRGETLKNWNLEKSPLFIKDGKNTLEVIYTDRVYTDDESKAYILVETEYVYFVVEYEIKIKKKEVKTYQMVETF